jgi:hypothetical protein
MGCGKGPGNEGTLCPAATESRLDGIHGGVNGGRACWVVAGTCCPDTPAAGTFARKMESCLVCPFYRQVRDEEQDFRPHCNLLMRVS